MVYPFVEERVRLSEAPRLDEVARLTTNPVVITDRFGCIEWVNSAFETLTGWSLTEVQGCKPGSFLQCANTDSRTIAEIGEAMRAVVPLEVEILNQSRTGQEYWIKMDIQPRFDSSGRHTGFTAVETDITDLHFAREQARRAEEEANRARARLTAALGALQDGFALFDAEDRLVVSNQRYRDLHPHIAEAMVQPCDASG